MPNTIKNQQVDKTTSPLKVVAYCRVSTENQKAEGTINLQVNNIKDYCKKKGYNLVEVFKDEGVFVSEVVGIRVGLGRYKPIIDLIRSYTRFPNQLCKVLF